MTPVYKEQALEDIREEFPHTWGYVYIVHSTSGHLKFGRSRKPDQRFRQLVKTQGPFEYRLVKSILTNDMYEFEKELHSRFANEHVRGEWFADVPEDDLDLLKSAFMYIL